MIKKMRKDQEEIYKEKNICVYEMFPSDSSEQLDESLFLGGVK